MSDKNPQAGNESGQEPKNGEGAPSPAGNDQASKTELSAEELRVELEKTRKEAAKNRTDRKALEDKVKALEAEKLSEAERKERELADREKAAAERERAARRREILAEAKSMGFVDPEDALNIPDDAEDVSAAIADLVKRKPHYLKPAEEPVKTTTQPFNPAREKKKTSVPAFDAKNPPSLSDGSIWSR